MMHFLNKKFPLNIGFARNRLFTMMSLKLPGILCSIIIFFLQFSCISNNQNIEKGRASLRLGDYSMAIRFFEDVLSHDPENYDARIGMGKALIQQSSAKNNDSTLWSKALTHLEAARSIRPESNVEPLLSEAWIIHARDLLNSTDTIAALKALSRALDLNPRTVEALNLTGIIYFKLGKPDKSQILFRRALAIDTTKSFTYFNIGMVKWSIHDVKGAHRAWFRAVQLAPQDKDIVYWYSVAEATLRESEQ
jgi:tetratricopeptide (TPR) repeat protein